jgi:MOSC domain-containing protein YiiM
MSAVVIAVHSKSTHTFSKAPQSLIELVEGHGVKNDAHYGVTVQHRSRVAKDPTQPNLRQVHLLHVELFAEVTSEGIDIYPGQMGENLTTSGINLLGLAAETRLQIGARAIVEITGLRNPCSQIENFKAGLLAAVLDRAPNGTLIRKAGVMGIVLKGGIVRPGDEIVVAYEPAKFKALHPV